MWNLRWNIYSKIMFRSFVDQYERSEARHFNPLSFYIKNNNTANKVKGFTLIEFVLVIIILGIMSVGIAGFITLSTQTYLNVTERDELLANARFVVERLNREIRNAVPNSIRIKNDTTSQCVEFVPIIASTIYTNIPVMPETDSNILSVIPFQGKNTNNDYQCPEISSEPCLDAVTVYPLFSSDIYDQSDTTGKVFGLKTVTQTVSNEWTLTLDEVTGVLFDDDSPTERLYIIRTPVSYCVKNNTIIRHAGYSYSVNQSLNPTTSASNEPPVLMANNIATLDRSNLPFVIQPATLQRNAMIQIKLNFMRGDENIVFNNETHIVNVP